MGVTGLRYKHDDDARMSGGELNTSVVKGRTARAAMVRVGQAAIFLCVIATSARAQDASTQGYRLSPTLYFPDPATELSSRATAHASVQPLVNALSAATSGANPAALVRQLRTADQTLIALQRHAAYLRVATLENTQDQVAKAASASVDADQSVLQAAVEKRLLQVPPNQIASLGPYSKLARDVQTSRAHESSPDVERYRGTVVDPLEQSIADAYDMQIDSIGSNTRDADARDIISPDLATRRAALARRNAAFDDAAPVTATFLATLIELGNRDAVAQGFHNAAERKYVSLGLSDTLVTQTLGAVLEAAPAYRRYEQVIAEHAAKRLGVPSIVSAELDLGSAQPERIPISQGSKLILDAFKPLGADYTRRFAALLDSSSGRLDLSGGAHRASAGTSISVYDAPVALYFTGYTGSLKSLSTIAHEGGHAIHRELMNSSNLPVYERIGPNYMSEGYAIFNELLLLDHAAQVAQTPAQREYALERLLAKISLEFFTSAEETTLERDLYTSASGHALLDRAGIDSIYRASMAPYEYWPMSDVGRSRGWMRKSLMFEDPLYLVNYLYASFVAVALYDKAHSDPDFASKYEMLLRRGFDADPKVLLASVGIQIDDPRVVKRAAELFKSKTEELQTLYAAENGSH